MTRALSAKLNEFLDYIIELIVRPIDFALSIDSIFYKPVMPSISFWFTFGMLFAVITVLLYLLVVRDGLIEIYQNAKQLANESTFCGTIWTKFKKAIRTIAKKIVRYISR